MKTCLTKNLRFTFALIAGIGFILEGRVQAQTFRTLHSFTAGSGFFPNHITNNDGAYPAAGLILSGNTLYGTARFGGSSSLGTLFAVNTDGTGFTTLHSFTGYPSDGGSPDAGLILSGNTLYGTTSSGGDSDVGTVFAVNTDGAGFSTLYSFSAFSVTSGGIFVNSDGIFPEAGLILSGSTLYGTAVTGGDAGDGTVFDINTDGSGFTVLHSFAATVFNSGNYPTNSDGAHPDAGLTRSGNTLYGTATEGGVHASGYGGTVFAINTDGTSFTTLHSFAGSPTDGSEPYARLLLSDNTLYGTTGSGGSCRRGTVFKVNTDGSGFTTLHNFTAISGSSPPYTNSDGGCPGAGLILAGHTLYGTAGGGSTGWGTVFALNTDGTGFTNLYNFRAGSTYDPSGGPDTNSDGFGGSTDLVLSGNTLYGTATAGGSSGYGTVFSITFTPQLTITHSGSDVILTWPTNYAGFDYSGYTLQSTTNLAPSAMLATVSPAPVIVNGQYTVTNAITGARQFYRLSE